VSDRQDDTQANGLWPATGGRIPGTPAEWCLHLDFMAERGRQLRAARAAARRRRLLAVVVDGGDGMAGPGCPIFSVIAPSSGCGSNITRLADASVEVAAGRGKGENDDQNKRFFAG
jgi:hypothetical protein